ncbi:hypothetical protein MLD38_033844 [Melastoma candidum]|uniref:Uncharacterized protein n=1 Tax=Melastoma candidum TaxID=119954 RepID=A0ACB9M867_9MYRT|nr:hypothetical protein MLD38_033844 [Melastoma candidum]
MSSSPTDRLESYPVNDPCPDLEDAPEQVSHCTGLRVGSIDSESDSDYLESEDPYTFDLGSEVVDGGGFEWEDVGESGDASNDVVEELTALSSDYSTDDEEDERWESGGGGAGGRRSAVRDLEWELLVAVNNVTGNLFFNDDLLYDIDGDAYYVEDSSEIPFDQFMDNVAEIRGSPPAAKDVVENLPVVVAEDGDSELCGGDCAVCKDEIGVGVRVRTLLCSHFYHDECILPWLEMRNTCPVCRYELPTDDAEYERSKTGDVRGRPASWDVRVNEEFELFV